MYRYDDSDNKTFTADGRDIFKFKANFDVRKAIQTLRSFHNRMPQDQESCTQLLKSLSLTKNNSSLQGLLKASFAGDVIWLDEVLATMQADINVLPDGVLSPLYFASTGGYEPVVARLIKAGANVNGGPSDRWKPLWVASIGRSAGVVALLLEAKVDVDHVDQATCQRATVLYRAAQRGYDGIVAQLLEAGTNANVGHENGTSPLEIALEYKQHVVVAQLIQHGVTVTPKALAAIANCLKQQVVQQVLEGKTDCNSRSLAFLARLYKRMNLLYQYQKNGVSLTPASVLTVTPEVDAAVLSPDRSRRLFNPRFGFMKAGLFVIFRGIMQQAAGHDDVHSDKRHKGNSGDFKKLLRLDLRYWMKIFSWLGVSPKIMVLSTPCKTQAALKPLRVIALAKSLQDGRDQYSADRMQSNDSATKSGV